VKIGDSRVQVEKSLCTFDLPKSQLASFLTSCRPMRLFNQIVAPGRPDHLLVIDIA